MTGPLPGSLESEVAIYTRDLRRTYRVGEKEVHALCGVNLEIPTGLLVVLRGRSGSGKTTLLNCLGGLDTPTSGTVCIFGKDLSLYNQRAMTAWRRSQVGFIFQSFALMPTLSAYENVELVLRIAGMGGSARRERALECLDRVGVGKWKDHRPYELSGGQQQRVAIARALALRPPLLLADEATGELDSQTAREMLALFREIVDRERVTFLVASHDALLDEYADRVLRIEDGLVGKD